ncbi:MAG: hypothetical protein AAF620_15360 [Bacteroidota bacterium]
MLDVIFVMFTMYNTMSKVRLSTSLTFLWKFVFPVIGIGGFGIGTVLAIWETGIQGLPVLLALVFAIILLYYGFIRAKNVYIDDNFLYVDNFIKTVKVPFTEISDVSENIFFTPRLIFVKFRHRTQFGKKIMFIGNTEMLLFLSTHPAVDKIRIRIKKGYP